MFAHPPIQIMTLANIKRSIFLALQNINKIHLAETKGFEPLIQFPVYTLSRRAPSTTRTSLPFLGRRKYNKLREFKKFHCILGSYKGYFIHLFISYTCNFLGYVGKITTFISFTPKRNRGKIRRIRFQNQSIEI